MKKILVLGIVLLAFSALPVFANQTVTVGESCSDVSGGTSCFQVGPQTIYNLNVNPASLYIFGEVDLLDADSSLSDIAAWTGNIFVGFSSQDEGLAGVGGNVVQIAENPLGSTKYVALFGMPGFDYGTNQSVTYFFHSDEEGVKTPEPASIMLLGTGLVGLAGLVRRKRIV